MTIAVTELVSSRRTARLEVAPRQVAAFRLARHHLAHREAPIEQICRDVCAVQAQLMSAAELALWTRRPALARDDIRSALWERRTIVRTALMRLTLHLVTAADFPLYVTALRKSRRVQVDRILARYRISADQIALATRLALEALAGGPLTARELIARVAPNVDRSMRGWIEHAWVGFRPAIVEGVLCYGPPRGAQVTLVRTDQWLPRTTAIDESAAIRELLRRFLHAYGPATPRDFSKWSGIPAAEAAAVWTRTERDRERVDVDGAAMGIGREDVEALRTSEIDESAIRLLPAFDPLLLAHASKDHLVDPRFYKRVYRNQGWLSPVVLAGGRLVACWFLKSSGRSADVDVQPFTRLSPAIRRGIEAEVDGLSRFVGMPCAVRFARAG